jgi:hypothetical protein
MRLSTDALRKRVCLSLFLALTVCLTFRDRAFGATYTTANFIVSAPTAEIAEKCGKTAEFYREAIAMEWLGKKMPRWYKPCTLTVKVGQIGAGGATTFAFDRGEVFGWRMNVQGSLERILDSVIPHEVSHTVFACHFRRPLPRWADEGAATLIEHESERRRQALLLKQVWNSPRRIPLRKLLAIKEYPTDMQNVLTLYAEGYSLADFLVQAGGKTRYLQFLDTAHEHGWDRAIAEHYSLKDVEDLENRWNDWVLAGSPQLNIPKGSQVASNASEANVAKTNSPKPAESFERPVIRAQSPEESQAVSQQHVASTPSEAPAATEKAMPLPKTMEPGEESAGWRRIREQMESIPDDFVNPANEPNRFADVTTLEQTRQTGSVSANIASTDGMQTSNEDYAVRQDAAPSPPAANEPIFRFELGDSPSDPGGQNSVFGRSPNWSDFPRNQTNRDPAMLENSSERPFSP